MGNLSPAVPFQPEQPKPGCHFLINSSPLLVGRVINFLLWQEPWRHISGGLTKM